MLQISLAVFLIFSGVFAAVMLREPRGLASGVSFFMMSLSLGVLALATAAAGSQWLAGHRPVLVLLLVLAVLAGSMVLAFPLLLLLIFFIEGIRVIRHEGFSPGNLLSLLFAALWFGYLFIWPVIGVWQKGSLGLAVYIIFSFAAAYLLALMAMYALSALLNLFHIRKRRRLDYIVVLGSGLNGDKLPPLLAGRVERGIALLKDNPKARLILSGGQGPGETVPESDAMAAYAIEKGVDPGRVIRERQSASTEENLRFSWALMEGERPRVAVVTTAYHVFRALILARQLGRPCVGFGAKTKWYFTLNAVLREFAGYLRLTRRRHMAVIGTVALLVLGVCLLALP